MKRFIRKLLILTIFLAVVFFFRAPLLTAYAKLFTVDDATQGADLMIVLSGNIDLRPKHAAKLYHEGYALKVFLTRERNWHGYASPYVDARNAYAELWMLEQQVPVEYLPTIHEEGAMSTMDEVLDTVAYVKQNPDILHIIVVTDTPHTYRASYAFKKVFRDNGLGHILIQMAAAPAEKFDETNWYTTELGLEYYFDETLKTLMYWIGLANTPMIVAK